MKVRFGIAPIAWTNSDLPELGGDTALETCLAESREAGFSGTETGVKFPMDAASLGSVLQRFTLKLVSGWFSGELLQCSVDQEKDRIETQLATFKALGASVLVYAETTGSVQSRIDAPLSQIQGAHVTGPYRWWTAVGARLSLADDGLTFGTNATQGVCIHFEPRIHRVLGLRDHSALNVTVEDCEGLVAALTD